MLDKVVPLVIKDNTQLSSPAKTKTKTRIKQLQNAPVYETHKWTRSQINPD